MRFNAAAFDAFLGNIGQTVRWRPSYVCACFNPHSGQADAKHQLCGGKGWLWSNPVDCVVGVASQKVQLAWVQAGMYEKGDLVVSIPQASPMYDAGHFDRVLMMNSTTAFTQGMQRGAPSERLLFTPAGFKRCFWLDSARQIVEGGLPVADANGNLSWPSGGEPPAGAQYSLTGTKLDEYYIYDGLPSDRGEHQGMRLPKKAVLRKWDLFGR